PLGYFSMSSEYAVLKKWRRERDSNPRYIAVSLVFKTSAINRSAISPCEHNQREILYPFLPSLSMPLFKKIPGAAAGASPAAAHGTSNGLCDLLAHPGAANLRAALRPDVGGSVSCVEHLLHRALDRRGLCLQPQRVA